MDRIFQARLPSWDDSTIEWAINWPQAITHKTKPGVRADVFNADHVGDERTASTQSSAGCLLRCLWTRIVELLWLKMLEKLELVASCVPILPDQPPLCVQARMLGRCPIRPASFFGCLQKERWAHDEASSSLPWRSEVGRGWAPLSADCVLTEEQFFYLSWKTFELYDCHHLDRQRV